MTTPFLSPFSLIIATYSEFTAPKASQVTFQASSNRGYNLRQRRPLDTLSRDLFTFVPPAYGRRLHDALIPDETIPTMTHRNRTFRNGTAGTMVCVLNDTSIRLEMNRKFSHDCDSIMQTMVRNPNLTAEVLTMAIKRDGRIPKAQLKTALEEGEYEYAKKAMQIKEALNNNSSLPTGSSAQDLEMTAIYLVLDGLDKKPSRFPLQKSNADLLQSLISPLAATGQDPTDTFRNLGPLLSTLISRNSEERPLLAFLNSLVKLNNG